MIVPQAHARWQQDRLAALVAEDGWRNLIDRIEIPQGPQRAFPPRGP